MVMQQAAGWLAELFAYNQGEVQRMHRAATAKGYGLNPVEYSRPYPGSVQTVNLTSTPAAAGTAPPAENTTPGSGAQAAPPAASAPSISTATKGVVAAGLTALALAVGGAVYHASTGGPAPAPQPIPAKLAPQDYEVDWSIDPATGEMIVSPPKRID